MRGKDIVERFEVLATVTSNQYFLLGVSYDSLKSINGIEDDSKRRRLVASTVVFLCSFLEAGINAIIDGAIIGNNNAKISKEGLRLIAILNQSHNGNIIQKLPTLDKYIVISSIEFEEKIDKGHKIFQDVNLLFKLRNMIMHPKIYANNLAEGEIVKFRDEARLIRSLSERYKVEFDGDALDYVPQNPLKICLTEDCAKWAFRIAVQFWNNFLSKLPNGFDADEEGDLALLTYVPVNLDPDYNFSPRTLFQMKEGEMERFMDLKDSHRNL